MAQINREILRKYTSAAFWIGCVCLVAGVFFFVLMDDMITYLLAMIFLGLLAFPAFIISVTLYCVSDCLE